MRTFWGGESPIALCCVWLCDCSVSFTPIISVVISVCIMVAARFDVRVCVCMCMVDAPGAKEVSFDLSRRWRSTLDFPQQNPGHWDKKEGYLCCYHMSYIYINF